MNYTIIINDSALKIHMSKNAHDALKVFPEFITEPRGDIFIKVNNNISNKLKYNLISRLDFQSTLENRSKKFHLRKIM